MDHSTANKNRRFIAWLRYVVLEAQEAGISLEAYSKMLNKGMAFSITRNWAEYSEFVGALVWLHSPQED